jgi:hypothetical protein
MQKGFYFRRLTTCHGFYAAAVVMLLLMASGAQASTAAQSCYAHIQYGSRVDHTADRALYIIIDQTTPLTPQMRQKISDMVSGWGKPGDMVKVVAFSANMRGMYPQLTFNAKSDPMPTEEYMYNLRWLDKEKLQKCLANQQEQFGRMFRRGLETALNGVNPEIPKTDLFYSLKQIAAQIIDIEDARSHKVLLVSDGLENSGLMSFYRKGKVKRLHEKKVISKVRRSGLIAHWKNAEIYMYGLGLPAKDGEYSNRKNVEKLYRFWERYFVEGNGRVRAIGAPELLLSSID